MLGSYRETAAGRTNEHLASEFFLGHSTVQMPKTESSHCVFCQKKGALTFQHFCCCEYDFGRQGNKTVTSISPVVKPSNRREAQAVTDSESKSMAPVLFPGGATCGLHAQHPAADTIHHCCTPIRSVPKSISALRPGPTDCGAAGEVQAERAAR